MNNRLIQSKGNHFLLQTFLGKYFRSKFLLVFWKELFKMCSKNYESQSISHIREKEKFIENYSNVLNDFKEIRSF